MVLLNCTDDICTDDTISTPKWTIRDGDITDFGGLCLFLGCEGKAHRWTVSPFQFPVEVAQSVAPLFVCVCVCVCFIFFGLRFDSLPVDFKVPGISQGRPYQGSIINLCYRHARHSVLMPVLCWLWKYFRKMLIRGHSGGHGEVAVAERRKKTHTHTDTDKQKQTV